MAVLLVFNELSAIQMAPNIADAQRLLEEFSGIMVDQRIRGRRVFVAPSHFLALQVSAGYSIGRWLTEYRAGDHERRLRIKTLLDRRSDYTDFIPANEFDAADVEYRYAGQTPKGLVVAFSLDGLALSFWSNDQWNITRLELEKHWIEGDELQRRTFSVLHACQAAHLEAHAEWLRRHEPPPPQDGMELWREKDSLLPSMDFCHSAEDQIKKLRANDPRYRSVLRGLCDLQNYCNSWQNNNFDIHQLANASGESKPTLDMYSEERTFRCPDGQYRVFEWHLKRGDTRIHFFDFPATKRILIGYVGPHLRIVSQ